MSERSKNAFKSCVKAGYVDRLKSILTLFDTVKLIHFASEENELINKPFPCIWGSIATALPIDSFHNGVAGEHMVCGNLVLGEDIQLAFTTNENVKKLKTFLKPYHVQVFSLDAAYFILSKKLMSSSSTK